MAKMKLKRMVTPAGIAVWPWLDKPDTKFKANGEYRIGVSLPRQAPGVQDFLTALEAEYDAAQSSDGNKMLADAKKGAKIKRADVPWKDELDENDQPTGNVVLNLKMAAKIEKKEAGVVVKSWDQRPDVFDAKGTRIDAGASKVGGGSTVKASFEIMPFYTSLVGAGISLRLRAVQVINLVQFQPGTAKGYGFGEEEGFTAPTEDDAPEAAGTVGATPDGEVVLPAAPGGDGDF